MIWTVITLSGFTRTGPVLLGKPLYVITLGDIFDHIIRILTITYYLVVFSEWDISNLITVRG